jgi:YbbR domain-containing protein
VLVQVGVAAIEGSMTLSVPVEIVGLAEDLSATISPGQVDVIIAGPLNVLDQLTADDFRVIIDLTGLPPGVYQRTVSVDYAPDQVRVQTTLPEIIEVTIELSATPTIPSTLLPNSTQTAPGATRPTAQP